MGTPSEKGRTMKLVDTDIFIDFFRGVSGAVAFLQENADHVLFSAITEAELLSGNICEDPREEEKVLHVLAQFEKIPVDNPLVQVAGKIRRKYHVELPDALIAASALSYQLILITRNVKDFQKIRELKVERPY